MACFGIELADTVGMTELKEAILRLKAEGKTYKQIKEELGCSKGTISYYLGAGQKEKTLVRQRDRRSKVRKYLQEVRQKTPCADCGENYPYWVMDFDHLPEYEKSFAVCGAALNGQGRTIEDIIEEVKKCEVVCSNCHRTRTYIRAVTSGAGGFDIGAYYK